MNIFFKHILLVFLLFHFSLYAHKGEDHSKSNNESLVVSTTQMYKLEEINNKYFSNIKPIFEKKCLDCHGLGSKKPWYYVLPGIKHMMNQDMSEAKKHLDMTNGFPFGGHGSPKEDLQAIKKTVREDSMPPWQYKMMHWNSKLTKKEKMVLNKWIDKSLQILNNGGNK
ncbi:MAG: heme-binding domain-containing protein [Bdellovibrionales bacterium]|nr:heme-binding domain-containing protein [Bdellovibrionales bacterium]